MNFKRNFIWIFLMLLLCLASPIPDYFFTTSVSTAEAAAPKLNYTKKNLLKSEAFTLKCRGKTKGVTYRSTNLSVATVSSKGVVKGKNKGKASILATYQKKTYTCKITVRDEVDIIIFSGQSNMTNVGKKSQAPKLKDGAGYEALLSSKKVSPIIEPFGVGQKKSKQPVNKQGASLVSAFANSYYKESGIPIVAINTAKGGTSIGQWSTSYYKEITNGTKKIEKILKNKGIKVRHRYMVFFQGENDGVYSTNTRMYKQQMEKLILNVQANSKIEKCLVIRIGDTLSNPGNLNMIAGTQTDLCMNNKSFVMISTIASGFDSKLYQSDGIHFTQKGLNKIGTQAGKYAAKYAKSGKEPSMKDPRYKNTYQSNCN